MEEIKEKKKQKYVTFMSGKEYFGLKIEYVNEIIVAQEITSIPETEDYIKGLINLRGKIIPVIDVRLRFKQEPFEYDDRTCIIVIKVDGTEVGLIVEKIAEVVEIADDNLIDAPTLGKTEKSKAQKDRYVYAIGKVGDSVKLLLDPQKLLNDDLVTLEQVAESADASEIILQHTLANNRDEKEGYENEQSNN